DAFNYDEDATIPAFNVQSDGTAVDACVYAGCTFYWACNYDPAATVNDGSCDLESCAGCQIEVACNYDPEATLSGDCTFAAEGYDCEGNCLVDSDMDGVCDAFEVEGCDDEAALNFDVGATENDGSCAYPVFGCTDLTACNFDDMATADDDSCEYTSCAGCLNPVGCNY
ncbi:MAG: hypothetical protein ACPH5L_09010, partial [Flavobacteriales bacterium]